MIRRVKTIGALLGAGGFGARGRGAVAGEAEEERRRVLAAPALTARAVGGGRPFQLGPGV